MDRNAQTQIVDETLRNGNDRIAISIQGQEVMLTYDGVFDSDAGEWDCAAGAFSLENYIQGIKTLKRQGWCLIQGQNCQLKIVQRTWGLDLDLSAKDTGSA